MMRQGGELSATGSGSIVKALQGPSREVVVRVPSRPASPAAAPRNRTAAAAADVSRDDVIYPPAMASREPEQRRVSDERVRGISRILRKALINIPFTPSFCFAIHEVGHMPSCLCGQLRSQLLMTK